MAFLDSDDLWDKNKLKLQLSFMIRNEYDLTYSDYYPFNDVDKKTIVSASSKDKELKTDSNNKIEISKIVGNSIGKKAIEAGINSVSFDRNGYLYHGRVKSLAEGAREAGLKF